MRATLKFTMTFSEPESRLAEGVFRRAKIKGSTFDQLKLVWCIVIASMLMQGDTIILSGKEQLVVLEEIISYISWNPKIFKLTKDEKSLFKEMGELIGLN